MYSICKGIYLSSIVKQKFKDTLSQVDCATGILSIELRLDEFVARDAALLDASLQADSVASRIVTSLLHAQLLCQVRQPAASEARKLLAEERDCVQIAVHVFIQLPDHSCQLRVVFEAGRVERFRVVADQEDFATGTDVLEPGAEELETLGEGLHCADLLAVLQQLVLASLQTVHGLGSRRDPSAWNDVLVELFRLVYCTELQDLAPGLETRRFDVEVDQRYCCWVYRRVRLGFTVKNRQPNLAYFDTSRFHLI